MNRAAFFKLCKYNPHVGQRQIHGARARPGVRHVVAVCGTRFGKTMAAAYEMAYEAIRYREPTSVNPNSEFMGWAVGPDHDKANLVFDACVQILGLVLKGHISVNKSEGVLEFRNLSGGRGRIMRRTAADASGKGKLVGYAVDFMVIDEAAKIPSTDIWENQLSTRLLDRQGSSLHISSPMGVEGYFANLYRKGQKGDDPRLISMQLPTWLNPYVDKAEIAYSKATLPRRVFDQEFGAKLLANGGLVFSPEDLEACMISAPEDPVAGAEYVGGLDFAMTNDHTVFTLVKMPESGHRPRVVKIERFYKMPTPNQIERVHRIQQDYNDAFVNVDESGIGKPVVEQMQNAGMNVRGVVTTGTGKTSKRAQIMNACTLVERRGLILPRREYVPEFWEEMTAYQWKQTPTGLLTASGPEGKHDDCVASFLLACWHIRAAGTQGEGQVKTKGEEAPARTASKSEGVVLGGDAVPEEVEVYQSRRGGRRGLGRGIWGG